MATILEKLVIEVEAEKKIKADAAEAVRLEEVRRAALAPKSQEEWFRIVYPSICEGEHEIYFYAGHWRLAFLVGGERFEIYDEYIPADSGTPTEGYMGHDAYWKPYLHLCEPNRVPVRIAGIECGLDVNSYINSKDTKRSTKDRKSSKEFCDDQIKNINYRILSKVKEHLIKKDDPGYRNRLDYCQRGVS